MSTSLPPIYRDCRRLLVHIEDMVRRFSRHHKYIVGTDLRQAAMAVRFDRILSRPAVPVAAPWCAIERAGAK